MTVSAYPLFAGTFVPFLVGCFPLLDGAAALTRLSPSLPCALPPDAPLYLAPHLHAHVPTAPSEPGGFSGAVRAACSFPHINCDGAPFSTLRLIALIGVMLW